MLNAKLECHLAKFHTFPHEVFAFIYTNRRPTRCARKFDMNMFHWIIIE